jgi:ribosomal protein L16 Arg81 hydroxylase
VLRHISEPNGHELQELLSPYQPKEFLAQYWGKQPLYIPGPTSKFSSLKFDMSALEQTIREPERHDRFSVRFVGADNKAKPKPNNFERYSIRDGNLTVCADWINERIESLASYCAGIKTTLHLPGSVFMTCYASPDGYGFGTHWDCQAVFVLQIEGSKCWRFSTKPAVQWPPTLLPAANVVPELMRRYPWLDVQFPDARVEEQFNEQVLSPGDVLFLPAGTWHRARAIGYSLALTIACPPMTAADFIDDLIRGHLSVSENWRCNVPPVLMEMTRVDGLPATVEGFFDARLLELRHFVKTLRAKDLYEAWTYHIASFDSPIDSKELQPSPVLKITDRLVRTKGFPLRYVVHPKESLLSVYYLDIRIDLNKAALPLVKAMIKNSNFTGLMAMRWLGKNFRWAEVRSVLQKLVEARVLCVER